MGEIILEKKVFYPCFFIYLVLLRLFFGVCEYLSEHVLANSQFFGC